MRAIQAAVQEGRTITVDDARQVDIAAQERRNADLERSKAESEAESQMAKEKAAKPAGQKTLLGEYEIPGIEGATNRVRVFQMGERIEAVGLDEGTANNDLSGLIQAGQNIEQALAALYGDHGPNEAPDPSRVKRAGQPGAVETAGPATIPATTGATSVPQANQAQQAVSQQPQAGGQAIAGPAAPAAAQPAALGGNRVQAAGLTDGATIENPGAQGTPAAGQKTQEIDNAQSSTAKALIRLAGMKGSRALS